MTQRWN